MTSGTEGLLLLSWRSLADFAVDVLGVMQTRRAAALRYADWIMFVGPKKPTLSRIEENEANGAWSVRHTSGSTLLALEAFYLSVSSISYRVRNMV